MHKSQCCIVLCFVHDSVSEDTAGQDLHEKHSQTVQALAHRSSGEFELLIDGSDAHNKGKHCF